MQIARRFGCAYRKSHPAISRDFVPWLFFGRWSVERAEHLVVAGVQKQTQQATFNSTQPFERGNIEI